MLFLLTLLLLAGAAGGVGILAATTEGDSGVKIRRIAGVVGVTLLGASVASVFFLAILLAQTELLFASF